MKCPIHGIEEVWQGSILKGGMVCEECEQVKEDAEMKVSMQPYTESPMPPLPYMINPKKEAQARKGIVDNGWPGLAKGNSFACPYCGNYVRQGDGHFDMGSTCFQSYHADHILVHDI